MKAEKFAEVIEDQFEICRGLLKLKADDYAKHDEDRLAQFKREAVSVGSKPLTICNILMGKHSTKLSDMIKAADQGGTYEVREWQEVITDHINI